MLPSGFAIFVDGPWDRHQVKVAAGPRMGTRHIFVKLDAQTRLARRDDIAFFPAQGLLEELRMEAVPALDRFEDEEVGRAGGELDIRRALDRAAIKMGRDLRVMRLRHRGDLLGFEKA